MDEDTDSIITSLCATTATATATTKTYREFSMWILVTVKHIYRKSPSIQVLTRIHADILGTYIVMRCSCLRRFFDVFFSFRVDDFFWISIKSYFPYFSIKIHNIFLLFIRLPLISSMRIYSLCVRVNDSRITDTVHWTVNNGDASPDKEKNWIFVQCTIYVDAYDESLSPLWISKHKSRNNKYNNSNI